MLNPNLIDIHIGHKLNDLRRVMGMTERDIGNIIGVTFGEVQKYEHGANRISASSLYVLSHYFNCPIDYFVEGLEEMSDS